MRSIIVVIFALAFIVSACSLQPAGNQTPTGGLVSKDVVFDKDIFSNDTTTNTTSVKNTTIPQKDTTDKVKEENITTITVTEGELVQLKPQAYDPDGNKITFSYSKYLNSNGKWQTKEGDAGKYLITVTADDGVFNVTKDVLIVVKPTNKAPTIECPKDISVSEGEEVFLDCSIFDADGADKDITVDYSGWMRYPRYKTTFEDAGKHTVLITAKDAFNKSSKKEVIVTVLNKNRAPSFSKALKNISVMEGEKIVLDAQASDPDVGDEVSLDYSKPFDKKGVWTTKIGDAGTYNAWVTASDGDLSVKKDFTVTVQLVNTAPALKLIPNISIKEGEVVNIKVDATDREGDSLKITYTGWMNTSSRKTTFDDARPLGCEEPKCVASYKVTVTVSDGILSTSQDVYVKVTDVPQPPVFTGILSST